MHVDQFGGIGIVDQKVTIVKAVCDDFVVIARNSAPSVPGLIGIHSSAIAAITATYRINRNKLAALRLNLANAIFIGLE